MEYFKFHPELYFAPGMNLELELEAEVIHIRGRSATYHDPEEPEEMEIQFIYPVNHHKQPEIAAIEKAVAEYYNSLPDSELDHLLDHFNNSEEAA
jgi:hypothetical protein